MRASSSAMTTRVVNGGTCDLSSSGTSTGWGGSGGVTGAPRSGAGVLLTRAYLAALRWVREGLHFSFLSKAPVLQLVREAALKQRTVWVRIPPGALFLRFQGSRQKADVPVLVNIRFLLRVFAITRTKWPHVRRQHTQASPRTGCPGPQPELGQPADGRLARGNPVLATTP